MRRLLECRWVWASACFVILGLLVALTLLFMADDQRPLRSRYDGIEKGMTKEKVALVLGGSPNREAGRGTIRHSLIWNDGRDEVQVQFDRAGQVDGWNISEVRRQSLLRRLRARLGL